MHPEPVLIPPVVIFVPAKVYSVLQNAVEAFALIMQHLIVQVVSCLCLLPGVVVVVIPHYQGV